MYSDGRSQAVANGQKQSLSNYQIRGSPLAGNISPAK